MKRIGIMVVLLVTVLMIIGCGKQSVAFDSQNDTAIFLREVSKGKTLEQPQDPHLEGHIFLGWYTDIEGGERWDFSQSVQRDMNLYARWEPISQSVTFFVDPEHQQSVEQHVAYGSYADPPPLPEIDGYRVAHWSTDSEGASPWEVSTRIQEDTVIYSQWETLRYPVFYHVEEGFPFEGDLVAEHTYGDSVEVSEAPEKGGFVFTGWNTRSDGTGTTYHSQDQFIMPAELVHLYPQWSLPVRELSAGSTHSMVLLHDGTLLATGYNAQGQLGDGTRTSRSEPVVVRQSVRSVSAGAGYTLFIDEDARLWGMGDNYYGQLGDAQRLQPKVTPNMIMEDVVSVSAGSGHTLVLRSDGSLWAMGNNEDGQLGDNSDTNRFVPVKVAEGVRQASAGVYHSLFIRTDGSLWAMGWNDHGQLGDGTRTSRLKPVKIMNDIAQAVAGNKHSLLLGSDGTVWGMGDTGSGQLGIESSTATYTRPVQVASDAVAIAVGQDHSLYIDENGVLWGTGANGAGQLGRALPAMVSEWRLLSESVSMLSAGRDFSLFVQSDMLRGTGSNEYGQLADWDK